MYVLKFRKVLINISLFNLQKWTAKNRTKKWIRLRPDLFIVLVPALNVRLFFKRSNHMPIAHLQSQFSSSLLWLVTDSTVINLRSSMWYKCRKESSFWKFAKCVVQIVVHRGHYLFSLLAITWGVLCVKCAQVIKSLIGY